MASEGADMGSTFTYLVADQFKRARDGDRFFYRNHGIFSHAQLIEIEKFTLARLICDTSDNMQLIHTNAFVMPLTAHQRVHCSSLPTIDLTSWKDDSKQCFHPDPTRCFQQKLSS